MDAWFARTLDAALEGAPVRVANLAASFKTGFQVVFRNKNAALETSWFTSAHDVISKLDEHLAQQKSSLRAYWLRHTKTKRVLFIATAALANELGATT